MFAISLIFHFFRFRICLSKSTILKSMFHCSVGPQTYAEIYKDCTGYAVIESPELPNRICNDCESKLICFHNFRLSIERTEERLEEYQAQSTDEFHIEEEKLSEEEAAKTLTKAETDLDVENQQFVVIEEVYEDEEESMFEEDHLYNDTDMLETDENTNCKKDASEKGMNTKEDTKCRFTISASSSKHLQCTACLDGCEIERSVNGIKPDEKFSITCECGNIFKNRRSFVKHYSTIHKRKDTIFPCRSCDEMLNTWRSRVAHEANVHSIGLKFECSTCTKKFYRSDHWKEHERICSRIDDPLLKFFSCAVCLFTFQREETYKKHIQTAHPGASESDKEFINRAEEYSQRYSKSRNSLSEMDSAEANEKTSLKDRPICTICKKIFKNDLGLQKHTSLFHTDQVWPCDKCDAVFVHRSTKISHMSREHGFRKPFECLYPNCVFSCFKKDRFNAHTDKHEDPDKKFPCPICQQEFKSYNTMTLHRARHLPKNTYVCATCSKQFLDKRNYNVHLKLHTGEDLHHCSVCLRGFNRKDHLQKHQERKKHYENKAQGEISG